MKSEGNNPKGPSPRRATIKDVARAADVSISVVSYVLNNTPGKSITEETRARVRAAAEALHYTPSNIARSMRSSSAYSVALISFWSVDQPVFVEIMTGCIGVANENGYNVIVFEPLRLEVEFRYVDAFRQKSVDGVIIVAPVSPKHQERLTACHLTKLRSWNIPAVLLNMELDEPDIPALPFPYYQAARMAVEEAIRYGHKELGYLYDEDYPLSPARIDRERGFRDALQANGLPLREEWIYGPKRLDDLFKDIQEKRAPSALVSQKALPSYHFLNGCARRGITVPDDISLISANSEPFASFLTPSLAVIKLPLRKYGQVATRLLINAINASTPGYEPLTVQDEPIVCEYVPGGTMQAVGRYRNP